MDFLPAVELKFDIRYILWWTWGKYASKFIKAYEITLKSRCQRKIFRALGHLILLVEVPSGNIFIIWFSFVNWWNSPDFSLMKNGSGVQNWKGTMPTPGQLLRMEPWVWFLDGSTHLYKRLCPSIRQSVFSFAGWFVQNHFFKNSESG